MNIYTQYALSIFTYVNAIYEYLYSHYKTTLNGIYDAYTPAMWVFSRANTYPSMLLNTWNGIPEDALVYYPNTHTLYKETYNKATMDIAMASIKEGGQLRDMSLFLYKVSWDSKKAPSIYELVILFYLESKIYVPYELLDTYTLCVLDSNAEEIEIKLESPFAKSPFKGFDGAGGELKID